MKIHLPNSAFIGNIDPFLRSFDSSDPDELTITSNKNWISVHPVVLSMVAALGMTLKKTHIRFENLQATSKHYLERMNLFKLLNIDPGIYITKHEAAGRFVPLTQIQDGKELTSFITEMIPLLHIDPRHVDPIRYIISELVRNVLEHSESKNGAILCAQYYKKSNVIRIGIADTGVGIKKTISQSYSVGDDKEALQLALTPGITGTTRREGGTEFNAGAGLFFIRSIAKVNRDFFMIYSGKALYKQLKSKHSMVLNADPFQDKHSIRQDIPLWQGTVVGVDISLDATKEFSALLELIRKTYIETVQERKKLRYKRPHFI